MTCRNCSGTGRVNPRYAFAGICPRCWGSGNEPKTVPEPVNGGHDAD